MRKQEFLETLKRKLSGLSKQDIEERLCFYSEAIDDRTEDGLSEEEAVAEIGDVNEIASQIIAETPFIRIAKERIMPERRLKPWEITLLVLGSPLWLSLIIAAVAVVFSACAAVCALIVSVWSVFIALVAGVFGGVFAGAVSVFRGNGLNAGFMAGVSLLCAGCAILFFFGCKKVTGLIFKITKKCTSGVKKIFVKESL